ncbi:dTMP kinase [Haloechinothrix sp. LS1_15]|uniref:dTMP kinase n=1 Tax=Haloechinothrix sp. LS1_15 TaxID=2652248 RepID=UPI00294AC03B|nr:dTMP kinase [Haloechinothrix sp. LS1_15]
MGRLVVIEGLDGAGKNTLAEALTGALHAAGASVARRAFPRYGEDIHADLAREALRGELGELPGSVYGMALLFALDRHGAAADISEDLRRHDVVLLDRYVASNAAYGAARLQQDAGGPFVEWVRALEFDRLGLPVPDSQIWLRVPATVAGRRAQHRERADANRARDAYESDDDLQRRCDAVYGQLVERGWMAPWQVVDGAGDVDAEALAATV